VREAIGESQKLAEMVLKKRITEAIERHLLKPLHPFVGRTDHLEQKQNKWMP
jgi:hypothetical protein